MLNVCSSSRKRFMTSHFQITEAQFCLFSAFAYPVAFGAGLLWSNLHKNLCKKSYFFTLYLSTVLGLVFFLSTSLVPEYSRVSCMLMYLYVACMSCAIPVLCGECFKVLGAEKALFGRSFVFALLGNVFVGPAVKWLCEDLNWRRLYQLATVLHAVFFAALLYTDCSARGPPLAASKRMATDSTGHRQADPALAYFEGTVFAPTLAGSSFSQRESPGAFILKIFQNLRYLAVLGCGFSISLSSQIMKLSVPSFLEESAKLSNLASSALNVIGTGSEFALLLLFPGLLKFYSLVDCFVAAIACYFGHAFIHLLVAIMLRGSSSIHTCSILLVFGAPLKGAAISLIQSTAPLLISSLLSDSSSPGHSSLGQKFYSASFSVLAGFIAGLISYRWACSSRADPIFVFKNCVLWSFLAVAFVCYAFSVASPTANSSSGKRAKKPLAVNHRYEALVIDNLYGE